MNNSEEAARQLVETKLAVDTIAAGFTLAALVQWLPPIVTFLTGIWVCLRIWESKTVQDFVAYVTRKLKKKDDPDG